MKKAAVVILVLFPLLLTPLLAQAQAPTPSETSTLGPVQIRTAELGGGSSVNILVPQSQSSLSNPIQLVFCVRALLIPECYSSVGNIGYSLDSGAIYGVNDFINETIIHGPCDNATVWAKVALPKLSEGPHSVTVYFGRYFPGINQRYEVSVYSTSNFSVKAQAGESIDVSYKVVILSPTSNTAYTGSMPLNFTVEWAKGNWTHWIEPSYSFSIDDKIMVSTNGGQFIDFEDANPAITVTNYTIDVSNLTDGMHKLTLYASGIIDEADLIVTSFNFTLATTYFLISTLPSFSSSAVAIFGVIVIMAVASVLLVYFKKHKSKLT
jgi:hypothetical protein